MYNRWEWSDCTRCDLHKCRRNVVQYRFVTNRTKSWSADIVFVGEAPGAVDDHWGEPFIGPAGTVLEFVIRHLKKPVDVAVTNTVCCFPKLDSGKFQAPTAHEKEQCWTRLYSFIKTVDPLLIVALGKVAEEHLVQKKADAFFLPEIIGIEHPSFLLHSDESFATQALLKSINIINVTLHMQRKKHGSSQNVEGRAWE